MVREALLFLVMKNQSSLNLISRRTLLKSAAIVTGAGAASAGFALAEPFRCVLTQYKITPPRWPRSLNVRIAVIADLHACEPWMNVARITDIVERVHALKPDMILLAGDYIVSHGMQRFARRLPNSDWAKALAHCSAPLGVYSVLGNHDWWDDNQVMRKRTGTPAAAGDLKSHGIPVLENDVVRLFKDDHTFWLAGLGDQWAFWPRTPNGGYVGVDDLSGTLAKIQDDSPILMLAHEPDIFPQIPDRVSLTICGHTHGGQFHFLGVAPFVPSRFGQRYRYGHIVENGRHLVVSAGLGCSGLPMRFGVPPEIVLIELGAGNA